MREFLRGLELDEETVDTIMAEVGKGYTKLQEQNQELIEQGNEYTAKINELNEIIKGNEESLENLQNITKENEDLKSQLVMSGNKLIMKDSNVKNEFSNFVTSEVMAQVDEDHDFTSVLENYKKENPQYFGETVVKKVQTSPNLNGGTQEPQTTNSIMNDLLRGITNN